MSKTANAGRSACSIAKMLLSRYDMPVPFDSLSFLLFFGVVWLLVRALPPHRRWIVLLIAGYAYYMSWQAWYGILLLGTTLVDYGVGIALDRLQGKGRRLRLPVLCVSICANLGLLFAFKYAGFVASVLNQLGGWIGVSADLPVYHWLLPVGISFYTFQSISYTIDVYRGVTKAERHLGIFATFVSFFPQLAAGPIERAHELLPQFRGEQRVIYDDICAGLLRFLWGLWKKVVIADQAAVVVDAMYASPGSFSGTGLLIGSYLFAWQIYCDFSGYCDMAIGLSRMLGFKLNENFNFPYAALSLADFWRRWHITLTRWFRDYVYIPLGGNRVPFLRQCGNLLFVFLLSGIWHGANWTFIIWGVYHGLGQTGGLLLKRFGWVAGERVAGLRIFALWKTVWTFHVVLLGWVFFRSDSIGDALSVLQNIGASLVSLVQLRPGPLSSFVGNLVLGPADLLILLITIIAMEAVQWVLRRPKLLQRFSASSALVRWPVYYGLLLSIILLGKFDGHGFLYFAF